MIFNLFLSALTQPSLVPFGKRDSFLTDNFNLLPATKQESVHFDFASTPDFQLVWNFVKMHKLIVLVVIFATGLLHLEAVQDTGFGDNRLISSG